ncbi:MAG: PEP-utilizing enzyme [Patescibacteria group bacterium]|nr:PEP-utilizing enzyme [Patescibacteria group bacterium]
MKINIDSRKELFKWGPISIKLIYPTGFVIGILRDVAKHYPWPWPPNICLFKEGKSMIWINQSSTLRETGLKYFRRYFLNQNNYRAQWKKFERWIKEYEALAPELENKFKSDLSKEDLLRSLNRLADLNNRFWLIVHVPEIANWGGEYLLKKELAKIDPTRADEYLEILSAPVKYSFFQDEELALLKLAPIKNKKELAAALKDHSKNWHWILNSYGGNRILSPEYFSIKLKGLLRREKAENIIREIKKKIEHNRKRKADLIKKLKLDKKIILIAAELSESIWWQDFRKGYIWRQNHLWDLALRAVEKNTSWKFGELQWCYFEELVKVVRGKIDKKEILKRRKYYGWYSENGKIYDFTDKATFQKFWQEYAEEKIVFSREIRGLLVSRGKGGIVRGIARIITDPFKEQNKFKPGEILVASMTSPEYIIVMRKAAAVITDYGGMTCHAAIVSRELGVPCLVNTRNATKLIKTGDLVEVDADKGIIKRLN